MNDLPRGCSPSSPYTDEGRDGPLDAGPSGASLSVSRNWTLGVRDEGDIPGIEGWCLWRFTDEGRSLFVSRVLGEGWSFGEPRCVEDARRFSLFEAIAPLGFDGSFLSDAFSCSAASVGGGCLREAGRFVSVGDGKGEASLVPFETEIGSGFLSFSFPRLWSASLWGDGAN
jgi:hypothetical protein